jgi:hypothetical protein
MSRLANIPRAAERLIVAETGLKLYQVFNDIAFPGESLADVQEYAQIMGVVWVGQLHLRPLNVSKVAYAIGMPRTTALRRLEELIAAGHLKRVGNHFYIADKIVISTEAIDRLSKIVRDAAAQLEKVQKVSKLDTK